MVIHMIPIDRIEDEETLILDVRQPEELVLDPLPYGSLHIPLAELPARLAELPMDKRLACLCAGNVRSEKAAEYLYARGFEKVCVLDKFSL